MHWVEVAHGQETRKSESLPYALISPKKVQGQQNTVWKQRQTDIPGRSDPGQTMGGFRDYGLGWGGGGEERGLEGLERREGLQGERVHRPPQEEKEQP